MRELRPSASNSKKEASTTSNEINKVTAKSPCYHCGKTGHKPVNCRFKETTCHFCGKVDHLKSVCYARKKSETQRKKKEPQGRPVLTVQQDTDEYPLYILKSPSSAPPINVSVLVEGFQYKWN